MIKWQEIFSKDGFHWQDAYTTSGPVAIARLDELKRFLDAVHIRFCLVKPYQEHKSYPLVEGRELLPSFDNDMFEYKDLPGFSMVAFARQLDYFSETFQFDKLHPIVMAARWRTRCLPATCRPWPPACRACTRTSSASSSPMPIP